MTIVAFTGLEREVAEARAAYLALRGYLRDDAELAALDGVFNALKSPIRLLVDRDLPIDQRFESLADMITSLHRVSDLLSTLVRHIEKRTGAGSPDVHSAIERLQESPSFSYLDHFTNTVKHTRYVSRGERNGLLYIDEFSYNDRGLRIQEDRRTSEDIIGFAQEVMRLGSEAMISISEAIKNVHRFDTIYAQVCATPSPDADNGIKGDT